MAAIYLKTFGAFWHTDATAQLIHTSGAHMFLCATHICEIRCLYVSGLPQKPDRRATAALRIWALLSSLISGNREHRYTPIDSSCNASVQATRAAKWLFVSLGAWEYWASTNKDLRLHPVTNFKFAISFSSVVLSSVRSSSYRTLQKPYKSQWVHANHVCRTNLNHFFNVNAVDKQVRVLGVHTSQCGLCASHCGAPVSWSA